MARPTLKDLNVVSRSYHFFIRLSENFGWRFVIVLLSAFVGVKGVLYTLGNSSYLPYIRVKAGVTDAARYQAFLTVARLPWSLKAMIGMVSDLLPVAGLHKRYYILGSAMMGTAASVVLSAAPIRRWGGGVFAAVLLYLISLESATGALWRSRVARGYEVDRRARGRGRQMLALWNGVWDVLERAAGRQFALCMAN